jgi:hypothetical protein
LYGKWGYKQVNDKHCGLEGQREGERRGKARERASVRAVASKTDHGRGEGMEGGESWQRGKIHPVCMGSAITRSQSPTVKEGRRGFPDDSADPMRLYKEIMEVRKNHTRALRRPHGVALQIVDL